MKPEENMPMAEEKLGYALVKARLLSDNQLKTALDYQRSLGGNLVDVIAKLGFVRPPALAKFLEGLGLRPSPGGSGAATDRSTPPPDHEERSDPVRSPGTGLRKEASRPDPAVEPEAHRRSPSPPPEPAPVEANETRETAGGSSDPILEALIQLLIKKGVFRRRELEEMLKVHA